jgi:CRP/FNR family nitrogen fixation transcriptional regulator
MFDLRWLARVTQPPLSARRDGEVHRFTAEAIVDTTLWIAKRRRLFARLAKGDISAANNTRNLVTRNLEHVENHLLLLGRQTALENVATFLLEIDRRLEQPEVMVLPMERQSIADYLGMTFETVCRVLSSLQEERILSLTEPRHRGIVLHDRSKLAQRDGRRIVSLKPSQAAHRPTSDRRDDRQ